ncbi:50S ribosomal L35 [Gossypium arboreum]|uniref:50S ribosomal L35 n=1 Tax=Gossypium arboreum TaxID=29729 RepID=A0A0B0NJN2_GOSAR|nr:50S ribosomal L35 [Gossypium arboreum]
MRLRATFNAALRDPRRCSRKSGDNHAGDIDRLVALITA